MAGPLEAIALRARITRPHWRRRFGHLGRGAIVHRPFMHNPAQSAPVRIGRGSWLAERVAVLKGADIGTCCIIGANSVVRGGIPDYSIAVGSPARVVGTVEGVDGRAAAYTSSVVPR